MVQGERASPDNHSTDLTFHTSNVTNEAVTINQHAIITYDGKFGISQTDPQAQLHVDKYGLQTTNTDVTNKTITTIASFSTTDFRSAKFMIQMEDVSNNNHLLSEIMAVYEPSGNRVESTEYAVVFTDESKGVVFSTDYDDDSGTVRVRATCAENSANRKFTVATMSLAHTA